jgi:hypothetical protein
VLVEVALITYKRRGVLSRTNGFSFFIELIGEKQHVGSCHTNGGVALKHPFSFYSHKKGRKSLTNLCCYKYHTLLHIVELFSQLPIKQ